MSEGKSALFAKTVQKHAGRAKEKLLQNLGKVDRTLDDIFEEHLQNFNRQHQQATRLQKEFNNYIRCIRAVQTASKSLMEAITEVYESGWSGHDLLYVQAQNLEMLWQDFSHKLGDQVLIPLNTYTNQFPEVRKKIEKRGRKLVDYDSQRHSFQNLQANAAKRRDDVKVTKGREQLEEAKRTYEIMNSELHDELPALYDSRVLFYVNNLQTLFSAEQLFHNESNKVYNELEAITDKLATESQRGSYKKPAGLPALLNGNGNGTNGNSDTNTVQTPPSSPAVNGALPPSPEPSPPPQTPSPPPKSPNRSPSNTLTPEQSPPTKEALTPEDAPANDISTIAPTAPTNDIAPTAPARLSEDKSANNNGDEEKKAESNDIPVGSPVPEKEAQNNNLEEKRQVDVDTKELEKDSKPNDKGERNDEVYDIPVAVGDKPYPNRTPNPRPAHRYKDAILLRHKSNHHSRATLAGLPAGTLYRVRATYRYTREDADELSFDVGDVIRVVEYDDPEEQEEGWLMGIKETTNEKGMFPANFTRPI